MAAGGGGCGVASGATNKLAARRSRLAMSLGGFDALDRDGRDAYQWLQDPPNCVAGGSNEVQLNVLSKRALELPEHK